MGRPKGSTNRPKDQPAQPKKARGKKAAEPKAAAPATPSTGSAVNVGFKKPDAEQVRKLVKRLETFAKEAKESGKIKKEIVDKAIENQHFDRTALGIVEKLARMAKKKPEHLAITLPHLLSYIDDLGLPEIADKARGLPINGEEQAEEATEGATATADAAARPKGRLQVVPKDDEPVPSPEAEVA